jgi:hypothetical protein
MADDNEESEAPAEDEATEGSPDGDTPDDGEGDDESKSFRERVEEIRQQRAEEGEEGEGQSREERMEEMMGGGGGPGGMGGNPFAQMMGGMMGGGGPGPGMGGPGAGPGPGRGEEESGGHDEELVREVRKLRDEVHDVRRTLDRIADALED